MANIHTDKRVARGSTYAMPVAPVSSRSCCSVRSYRSHPSQQELPPTKPKRKRLKETIFEVKAETQKCKYHFIPFTNCLSAVRPNSHCTPNFAIILPDIPVPLEQYLVEQETPIATRDESEQTDVFRPKPIEREYYTRNLPKKRGIDASTQIEPEDNLFDFDWEVEPLLNVLIGKTLELGLMEVEEEAELEAIREDKANYMAKRAQERDEQFAAEAAEVKREQEKNVYKKEEQGRVQAEAEVAAKVFTIQSVKMLIEKSKVTAFEEMEKQGLFYDPDWKMVNDTFMPWLYGEVDTGFEEVKQAQGVVDDLIQASLVQQKRLQDARWMVGAAGAADRRIERDVRLDDEQKERLVRIFLEGKDLGLGPDPVGPIPILQDVPLDEVEESIQEWIKANVEGAPETPEGGYLKLAFDGADLDGSKTLQQLQEDGVAIGEESVLKGSQGIKDDGSED
jgi:hypothetical protein